MPCGFAASPNRGRLAACAPHPRAGDDPAVVQSVLHGFPDDVDHFAADKQQPHVLRPPAEGTLAPACGDGRPQSTAMPCLRVPPRPSKGARACVRTSADSRCPRCAAESAGNIVVRDCMRSPYSSRAPANHCQYQSKPIRTGRSSHSVRSTWDCFARMDDPDQEYRLDSRTSRRSTKRSGIRARRNWTLCEPLPFMPSASPQSSNLVSVLALRQERHGRPLGTIAVSGKGLTEQVRGVGNPRAVVVGAGQRPLAASPARGSRLVVWPETDR